MADIGLGINLSDKTQLVVQKDMDLGSVVGVDRRKDVILLQERKPGLFGQLYHVGEFINRTEHGTSHYYVKVGESLVRIDYGDELYF